MILTLARACENWTRYLKVIMGPDAWKESHWLNFVVKQWLFVCNFAAMHSVNRFCQSILSIDSVNRFWQFDAWEVERLWNALRWFRLHSAVQGWLHKRLCWQPYRSERLPGKKSSSYVGVAAISSQSEKSLRWWSLWALQWDADQWDLSKKRRCLIRTIVQNPQQSHFWWQC